jgi:uncharacterized protein YndB with AHSA1/START domain
MPEADATETDPLTLSISIWIDAPPARVWGMMTQHRASWWCPAPWRAEVVEEDWRAGGRDAMVFKGPDGEAMPQDGIFLEVTPGVRFVATDAFTAGWVPAGPFMVGIWEIAPEDGGTRYNASARHWTAEAHAQHRDMGFEAGWMAAAQQLKALCEQA